MSTAKVSRLVGEYAYKPTSLLTQVSRLAVEYAYSYATDYPAGLTLPNPGAELPDVTTGFKDYLGSGRSRTTTPGSGTPYAGSYGFIASTATYCEWVQYVAIPSDHWSDVDAGLVDADFSAFLKGYGSDADAGELVAWVYSDEVATVPMFVQGGTQVDPTNWTQQTITLRLPIGARSLGVGIRGKRYSGSELSFYQDDFSIILRKSGTRSRQAIRLANADMVETNVTSTAGTLSSQTLGTWTHFKSIYAVGSETMAYYKDAILAAEQLAAVDTGNAAYEFLTSTVESTADSADAGRSYIEFRDGSDNVIGARIYDQAAEAHPVDCGAGYTLRGSVPIGARKVRWGVEATRHIGSNCDYPVLAVMVTIIAPEEFIAATKKRRVVTVTM